MDSSKWGFSKWGNEEDYEINEEVRKHKKAINPSRDALIGVTALRCADIYVSNDKERTAILQMLVKKGKLNVKIVDFDELMKWIDKQIEIK